MGRPFWTGFTAGWAAYAGLLLTSELAVEPGSVVRPLLLALANTLPYALVSAVVAMNRRRLLRPEWPMAKTLVVHALVGLIFTVIASALLYGLTDVTGLRTGEMADQPLHLQLVYLLISGLILYVIFLGLLMWSESVRRVRETDEAMAREAILRAKAEAKALRAQFNPHFVFNTLHSLMLLVRADPAAAERAIEDVATLIRFASIVQRRDLDTVPLAKELEVARRYVDLEQLRLDDRLRVRWHIDVDPTRFAIPAFALQTLVENAIKHGIEPRVSGGSVVVRVDHQAGRLRVAVDDDGVGADRVRVEAQAGHGLDLLRRRFESRYGSRGSVSVTTAPGEGFGVVLEMPAERATAQPELDVIDVRPEHATELSDATDAASPTVAETTVAETTGAE